MKTYICIEDYQGGEFGMYRNYTAEEWGEQAFEWADSDGWENSDECLLKNFKTEQDCIDFIQDMWEIKLVEVNKNNKDLIDFLHWASKSPVKTDSEWAKTVLKKLEEE